MNEMILVPEKMETLNSKLWGMILATGFSFRADGRWTLWAIQSRHINFRSWKVNSIRVTALAKEEEVGKSMLPPGEIQKCGAVPNISGFLPDVSCLMGQNGSRPVNGFINENFLFT